MNDKKHITLIGAGIMSATLGVLLDQLMPNVEIEIYERLDRVGAESSNAWNNAGTGHSAFCELNYTPYRSNGEVDISKALKISESFEVSKQLWAYLKQNGHVNTGSAFINDIDHMSFVWGDDNIKFLKKRYESLTKYAMFQDMLLSEDHDQISDWIPLMMIDRPKTEDIAVTKMAIGTDVNFGAITKGMINYLEAKPNITLHLGQEIEDLTKLNSGQWLIEVSDMKSGKEKEFKTDFVFIGAGGGSLPLLEKSDIPEGRGYGGFPVSGQFLVCKNEAIINQHEAKVYGKAATGSPPMSVPHLDTRMLDGKRSLLFGPYAGFSTKFLKNGSLLDLPLSIEMHNVWPMLAAGMHNIELTKYLIKQVFQSPKARFKSLQAYYPTAKFEDWELITAGQRVQIIKQDKTDGGVLKFGTEIVSSNDKSLAALLGASPGASTATSIMLDILKICFSDQIKTKEWIDKIREMIPSYGHSLITNGDLCLSTRARTTRVLKLEDN